MVQGFGRSARARAEALRMCVTAICEHPSGLVNGENFSGCCPSMQGWADAAVRLITAVKHQSAKGLGLYQLNRQLARSPLFGVMFFKALVNV